MNNIVNVAQISLAVIQYSVAAVLVGSTAARIPRRTTASASAKGRVKS
jgi:hypothetical protein